MHARKITYAEVQRRKQERHRLALAQIHSASLPRRRPSPDQGRPQNKQKPPAIAVAEGFTDRTLVEAGDHGGCCPDRTT
jgi:hypothetical protein